MDKSKNRTDLLAAGRKKLQQFRQKKDHKGSSSHGKSSGKSSKSEDDGGAGEPSKVAEANIVVDVDVENTEPSDPLIRVQHAELPAIPSAEEGDGVVEEKDSEELARVFENDGRDSKPAAEQDHKEANCLDSEQCNGESLGAGESQLGNGVDDSDENIGVAAPQSGTMGENSASDSSLTIQVAREVDEPSFSSKLSHEGEGVPTVSSVNLEFGFSGPQNGRDEHEIDRRAEEPNGISAILTEKLQEAGKNLSDKPEESSSCEENLEVPSSSQDIPAFRREDGAAKPAIADAEVEGRNNEGTGRNNEENAAFLISGYETNEEANGSSVLTEGFLEANMNLSDKPEESYSLVENSEVPSSSQDIPASNGEDSAVTSNAEGEGGNNEVCVLQSFLGRDVTVVHKNLEEISELGAISPGESSVGFNKEQAVISNNGLEGVKRHLYLTNVANDVLQLQLAEQTDMSAEYYKYSSDEVSKLWGLVKEAQESKSAVSDELAQCRSELRAMAFEKEALEVQCLSAKEEIEELHVRVNKEDFQVGVSDDGLESIREHLYLANVAKDVLQLQLAEQTDLVVEYCNRSSDEVSTLWDLLKEAQESKSVVSEELAECRSELRAVTIEKEKLEVHCLSTKEEIDELRIRANELQSKLELSQEELSHVLAELADCRGSLEALQKENLNINSSLHLETDAKKKLMEEKEFFSFENMKLSSELVEQKEELLVTLDKQVQLQNNLGEMGAYFERLTEENLYLSSSLDIHKAKLKELDGRDCELPLHAQEAGKQGILLLQKDDDTDISVVLGVLKGQLEEAKNILQNLEKAIEGMHSHSVSLSKSAGRVAAPGVSKLIQAFESKSHHVENISDEVPLTDGGHSDDSYPLTKEQTCRLRYTLEQIELNVGKSEVHLMEEQNIRELSEKYKMECETQKQQNSILQERFESLVEKVSDSKSKIVDLENHMKETKKAANEEVAGLIGQVELLQKELNERVSVLKQEADSIRGVTFESIEKLNESTRMWVDDNLDVGSNLAASVNAAKLAIENLHEKLEAARLNHTTVKSSYEELNKLFGSMQERNEFATGLLNNLYNSLRELMEDLHQSAGEAGWDVNADEVLQHLPENSGMLIGRLQKLLDERLHLLSTNNELQLALSNRNEEIEELKMRCNSLATKLEDQCHSGDGLELLLMNRNNAIEEINRRCLALAQRLEDHDSAKNLDVIPLLYESSEVIVKSDNMESDLFKSLLFRLEALIASHLQKYEQAIEQINLSKNILQEVDMFVEISADYWSLPFPTLLRQELIPKVSELQQKLNLLSASNLQRETEMQILKEGLSKMEESLEASRSELHLKVSELEQSEQRVSSVREKLSIAVAKGKGLIVQRDSLKQSLMEKSRELEKCQLELQSKEALLHEVEAKLKSCSEVERVEALESELSYIRNSATAMRDSFLLKDSVLQRIEEVLEDLDLPEDFHSKDVVEKIELLSRMAASNSSFPMTDWDQKSSEGHSHSGAVVATDAWKDAIQTHPELDELRRKYEELQSKFYGLAEHNDMLEQSLVERNSLVQKWEEVLDSVDMPPQFRALEPEDRIECLGRALSEVQQERDSLQHKIENLEVSSDMLIVDLEESHKKISELSAEVVAVKSDKEFFSESLDKLRFEYLALSEKAVHDELEKENLRKELADMQEQFVEKVEKKDHHDTENEMWKLHDLVRNTLPDSDKSETLSGGSAAECLEGLLRKLIDNYITLSSEKSMHKAAEGKAGFSEESSLSVDIQALKDLPDEEQQDLVALRLGLDEASRNLVLVKEERDAAMEKCRSLMSEIEDITRLMNLLQEERTKYVEKSQSLVSELEAIYKQRDALRVQLTEEEQKSASVREKLNVAVRKGKGLVQQRDSLKQTMEELNGEVECLKSEHNQQVGALESEKSLLMNQLAETGQNLQDCRQTLRRLLTALHAIDVNSEVNIVDPVQKMEEIGKLIRNQHSALVSSENEATKSKRAAELLLAELNEVQERADILQEELVKAEASFVECSKQKDDAESVKSDALSRLEHFTSVHSEERKKQVDNLVELKAGIDQLRNGCFGISSLISNVFIKDLNFLSYMETSMEAILKQIDGGDMADLRVRESSNLLSSIPISEEASCAVDGTLELQMHSHFDDTLITEHLAVARCSLLDCTREHDDLKEKIQNHYFQIDQRATGMLESMESLKRKLDSQKEFSESLKRDATRLELVIKEKETEICSMHKNVSLLFEACRCSIMEIENRKAQIVGNRLAVGEHASGEANMVLKLPSNFDGEAQAGGHIFRYTDDHVRMMAESLISTVKSSSNINEITEGNQRELKATISDLQRELQEKDIEMNRVCSELVSQIREAEAVTKRSMIDLDSARTQAHSLEKKVAMMENDKKLLESRVTELEDWEASSKELQERVKSLTDALAAKDQEIEALMQALDEEESQMEDLENRNKELENILQEKILALENLEASRAKVLTKLSTTVSKFDELHNLSENLLAEVENLQSQGQERDSEISFLRQEVTRCTNDVLASQETSKKYSSAVNELLTWMDMVVSRFGEPHVHLDDQNCSQIHAYTDILDKKIASIMAELEDLQVTAQSKDALLQIERGRVEELLSKTEVLETTLCEKETHIKLFQGERNSSQPSRMNSPESLETEQMVQRNKVTSSPIMTHVRSGRKVNNDQIAVAIDMERDDNVLEDEDDDKAHGFKSLTMSRLVPRATRPVADRIDGIWVSGERLLMRQPTLRLGVLIYWVALHALLASFI